MRPPALLALFLTCNFAQTPIAWADDALGAETIAAFKPAAKNSLGFINSGYTERGYDERLDSLAKIAKEQTGRFFGSYFALCSGKVVIRTAPREFYQFSGSKPDISIVGVNPLRESDLLNGTIWSGELLVNAGKSARRIRYDQDGSRTVSDWDSVRSIEVELLFRNSWQIKQGFKVYLGYWADLNPDVICSDAGL